MFATGMPCGLAHDFEFATVGGESHVPKGWRMTRSGGISGGRGRGEALLRSRHRSGDRPSPSLGAPTQQPAGSAPRPRLPGLAQPASGGIRPKPSGDSYGGPQQLFALVDPARHSWPERGPCLLGRRTARRSTHGPPSPAGPSRPRSHQDEADRGEQGSSPTRSTRDRRRAPPGVRVGR
jgi:hypothetical protein